MTAYIIVTFADGSSLDAFVTDDVAESFVVNSDNDFVWNILSDGGK